MASAAIQLNILWRTDARVEWCRIGGSNLSHLTVFRFSSYAIFQLVCILGFIEIRLYHINETKTHTDFNIQKL